MSAILKTWPAFMEPKKVLQVFTHDWGNFYFTLGRGKPQRPVEQIYFTHRGRILGHFSIGRIVINDGSLPKLRSLSDVESEWQIRGDNYVAICPPPFHRLESGPVVEDVQINNSERDQLARRDGFKNWEDMLAFWNGRLPFYGHIIHWKFPG